MKLSELQTIRAESTVAASDQARTLALAGLAIVWLFAGPFFQGASTERPASILFGAGVALSIALACDLLQLMIRAALLQAAYTKQERQPAAQNALRSGEDPAVGDLGGAISVVTGIFFFAKAVSLSIGYALILGFFWKSAT